MAQRNLIIVGIAVFLGLIAVYLANTYFSVRETQQAEVAQANQMARIVVASQELAFGTPITTQNVRLANWPAASVPQGAFTSLEDATKSRVALRPIVPGEPVLASKVSGANGRATLSANLPAGQVAFAIPVNDVSGVAGFIRPGDTVNVLLTRQIPGDGSTSSDKMTDVVLEDVPVLGIDQTSDENKTDPAVGKTATLQVDTRGAQKLALAQQLGSLSLALRNVADQPGGVHPTVTQRDISASRLYIGQRAGSASGGSAPARAMNGAARAVQPPSGNPPAMRAPRFYAPTMTIVRGTKTSQEEVLRGY